MGFEVSAQISRLIFILLRNIKIDIYGGGIKSEGKITNCSTTLNLNFLQHILIHRLKK